MKTKQQDLDRYLDGDVPLAELRDQLRLEEEQLSRWLGTLREDVRAPRALREGIMRRVAETPVPPWRRLADWTLRPRTMRLTPAAGALAVAASALLLTLWPDSSPPAGLSPEPSAAAATGTTPAGFVTTRFVFVAPEVGSVHVTGDFLSWDPEGVALEDIRGTGIWTADVALPPGVYQYTFIVDGARWQPDPLAVSQVSDGFGQVNSVLIVSPRTEA
jgi:hypothetical protein